MRKILANLTEKQKQEHIRQRHAKNMREAYQKNVREGYLRLISEVLDLHTINHLSLEEIALKMAENEQFRVIYKPKTPKSAKNAEK